MLPLTMASRATWIFCLLVAGEVHAASLIKEEQAHTSIVRRHAEEAQLLPSGELVREIRQIGHEKVVRTAPDPSNSACDHDYVLGAVSSGVCNTGERVVNITGEQACSDAADALCNAKDSNSPCKGFGGKVTNDWKNPLSFPHYCFIKPDDKHVYFNPTQTFPTAYVGRTICVEEKFPYAKKDTQGNADCPPNFMHIFNFTECKGAHACDVGADGCQDPASMQWDNLQVEAERPKGCYVDEHGCFRFNSASSSTWKSIKDQAVCKRSAAR
jgi:hypothetical protein